MGTLVKNIKGLTFPLQLTNGKPELSEVKPLIGASLVNIVCWERGTFPFRPNFGSRLHEVLHEPNSAVADTLANIFIKEAVSSYEQRVRILDIVQTMPKMNSRRYSLKYSILGDNQVEQINL